MEQSRLAGRSILVVEDEPFVAHCLKAVLEDAGADVHGATNAAEALRILDSKIFTASVLSCSKSIKGCRRVAHRLDRLDVPFVVSMDASYDEAWPDVAVLIKPVRGFQVIETLSRLIQAKAERLRGAASGGLPLADQTLALAGAHALPPRINAKEISHGKP